MDSQKIYEKIDNLRQAKGLSKSKLCELADLSHGALDAWQKRNTMPTYETLVALCNALQISYIQLFADEAIDDITEEERRLLEGFSTLTKNQKKVIFDMIKALRSII